MGTTPPYHGAAPLAIGGRLRSALMQNPEQQARLAERGEAAFPQATAAIGFSRGGWDVLPLVPNSKRLDVSTGFGPDRRPAFEDVRDLWLGDPRRNVGIAWPSTHVVADVDIRHGATLADLRMIGLDTSGLRFRSGSGGWHLPFRLPAGIEAVRGAHGGDLPRGIELLGPRTVVVEPFSRVADRWYRLDPSGGDTFGEIAPDWPFLHLLTTPAEDRRLRVTVTDRRSAAALARRLAGVSRYRETIKALFGGDHEAACHRLAESVGASPHYGRPFVYLMAASHFLRDHKRRPAILAALLHATGWLDRFDLRCQPSPAIWRVVSAALASRDAIDRDRLDRLRHIVESGADIPPTPPFLLDRTDTRKLPVFRAIWAIVSSPQDARFWAPAEDGEAEAFDVLTGAGFRRIPVDDLAAILEISSRTVGRALREMEAAGTIERMVIRYRWDGAVRADSLARPCGC